MWIHHHQSARCNLYCKYCSLYWPFLLNLFCLFTSFLNQTRESYFRAYNLYVRPAVRTYVRSALASCTTYIMHTYTSLLCVARTRKKKGGGGVTKKTRNEKPQQQKNRKKHKKKHAHKKKNEINVHHRSFHRGPFLAVAAVVGVLVSFHTHANTFETIVDSHQPDYSLYWYSYLYTIPSAP